MVQTLGHLDDAILQAPLLLMRPLSWSRWQMEAGEFDSKPLVLGLQEEVWWLWFEGFTSRYFRQRCA